MTKIARTVSIAATLCLALGAGACKKKDTGGEAEKSTPPPAETKTAETAPPAEAEKPATPGIKTEELTYNAGPTVLNGFLAYPDDGQKHPGVLIVHEWWGQNQYVRDRAKQLAQLGYTAFALDMYGKGKTTEHAADAQKFMEEVTKMKDQGLDRFKAAYDLLAKQPATKPNEIAAIGYCYGGGVVLNAARAGMPLSAVASFHGMLATKEPMKKGAFKGKIFVATGAADPFVPKKQVDAFKKEMDDAGADYEVVAYDGRQARLHQPGRHRAGQGQQHPGRLQRGRRQGVVEEADGAVPHRLAAELAHRAV